MIRIHFKVTAFLVTALFATVSIVSADLQAWNDAISADNPLNWYRFDETIGSSACVDWGTDGLNGTYSNVTLGQEGLFGPQSAADFNPVNLSELTFNSGTDVDSDWTVEYILKKKAMGTQALHDSPNTSVRLEGWNSGGEVGFTLYGLIDYYFSAVPGESLQVPLDQWTHLVFRRNAEGTQVFVNGVTAGTHEETIAFPRTRIGRGMVLGWDHLNAVLDEAVFYDRALDDATIGKHARAALPILIPDYFELYEDSDELQVYWNGDAEVTLETVEIFEGNQSMKAAFMSAGNVIKDVGKQFDYSPRSGQELIIMFKGLADNAEGDVSLSILDPNGLPLGAATYTNGTLVTDWTEIRILVSPDPNESWTNVSGIKIDVGAPATMYFDNLEILIPQYTAKKVLEWRFNEGGGKTATDSSGNGINGSMTGFVTENWIAGGRTGQAGDWAIAFTGAQNQSIKALNIDLSAMEVQDIFKGASSWTINIWLKLPYDDRVSMIGGFGDCDWTKGDGSEDRYFNKWKSTVDFNYGDNGFWYNGYTVDQWQMWTVTYNKWTKALNLYRNGEMIGTRNVTMLDTPEYSVKLGNVGTVAWTPAEGEMVTLVAQIDDFGIWDSDLPWFDEDPDTDDIMSLYGSWICYERPDYDLNEDCQINLLDIVEILTTWLDSGRFPEE